MDKRKAIEILKKKQAPAEFEIYPGRRQAPPAEDDWKTVPDSGDWKTIAEVPNPKKEMGDIVVHLANGKVLHFPEGTPDHVLDGVAKMESLPPEYSETPEAQDNSVVGATKRYFSNLGRTFDPRSLMQATQTGPVPTGILPAAGAGGNLLYNILQGHLDTGRKAVESAKKGEYSQAAGYGAATALPLAGPMAAGIGEQMGSGDIAGGLGTGTGVAIQALLGKSVPFGFQQAKRIINGMNVRKLANTGLLSAEGRGSALTAGIKQLISETSGKTNIVPSTSAAGKAVKVGLSEDIAENRAASNIAYSEARKIAEHPSNQLDVIVGVKEGEAIADPITGEPIGMTQVPVIKKMALPVDVSPIQMQAKELLDGIDSELLGQKSTSPAYAVLKKIANGPAKVPFGEAIEDVSTLGRAGFSKDPLISARSDAIARSIWKSYRDALDKAAESDATGQAKAALEVGRAKYRAMIDTKNIAKRVVKTPDEAGKFVPKESVKVIRGLTGPLDVNADMLEALKRDAPRTIPDVAKGFLTDILDQATIDGGFNVKEWSKTGQRTKAGFNGEMAFKKWTETGQRTKAVLFGRNEGLQQRLDAFFQAAKVVGNTETGPQKLFSFEPGKDTGSVRATIRNAIGAKDYYLTSKSIEKLLYTKSGADLLTRALTMPSNGAGAKALSNLIYINSVLPSSFKKSAAVGE